MALATLSSACEVGSTDVSGGTTEPTAPTGLTATTGATATTGPTSATGPEALEGTWEGTWGIEQLPDAGTFSMEIAPTTEGFSGTIRISNSECVTDGMVTIGLEGDRITFGVVQAEQEVSFTGRVSGDRMSGTWEATACPPPVNGIWEAARSG